MANFPFPLQFKRSARAKRVRLTVKAAGVECVMPLRCSEQQALCFIDRHREWLLARHREAVARVPERTFWDELADRRESTLPLLGREIPLRLISGEDGRSRLHVAEDRIQLHLPERHRLEWARLVEGMLFAWARGWLAEQAAAILRHHQSRVRLQPGRVCIKRMRTRWGSCGAHNAINLNWLLTFAPPGALEYVVVHELCHVRHRDHSAQFWALVGEHLPAYPEQRSWLKAHGQGLIYRFGGGGR